MGVALLSKWAGLVESCYLWLRSEEEEVVELLSVPEFGVTFTRILHTGVPTLALSSVPQFKVTFAAELLEVCVCVCSMCAAFM